MVPGSPTTLRALRRDRITGRSRCRATDQAFLAKGWAFGGLGMAGALVQKWHGWGFGK